MEHTLDRLDFSTMTDKDYHDNLGKVAKTGASAAALAVRLIKDLKDTVQLLGHSVRGLQDQVSVGNQRKVDTKLTNLTHSTGRRRPQKRRELGAEATDRERNSPQQVPEPSPGEPHSFR